MLQTERINFEDRVDGRVIDRNFQEIENYNNTFQTLVIDTENWVEETDKGDKTYYTKTFNVINITSLDIPFFILDLDEVVDITSISEIQQNYNNLFACECGNGSITIYSKKIPTSNFTVVIKGIGGSNNG